MKIDIQNILVKIKRYCIVNSVKLTRYALMVIAVFILFCITISPINRINKFRNVVRADSLFIGTYDSSFSSPEMKSLLKELTYKKALLKLAEQDSIQLVINLRDSLVCLSIKGVIIHSTKIDYYKNDLLLSRLPSMEYSKLFGEPLPVYRQYSTIVKEPVVVRDAPKDTIEATMNAYTPDTLIQNPAFVQLRAAYGINIIIKQDLNPTVKDKLFYAKFNLKIFGEQISDLIRFKGFAHQNRIVIKIPNNDLRAIYRALPKNTLLVLIYD